MNSIELLDDLIPIYEDTTYNINKINIYTETIFREYFIENEESELKVLKESSSNEELEYLFQESKTKLGNKIDLSLKKMITTVKTFDAKVNDNITKKFKTGSITKKLKKAEEKLKKNQESAKSKVEIIDIESEIKNIEKTIDSLHNLTLASVDENNIGKMMEEANDINTKCQKERKRINKTPIECQLLMLISLLKKRVLLCTKELKIDSYFIDVKKDDTIQKQQLIVKINGMIAQLLKEKKSILYSGVNDAYKKIMKSNYKEIKENGMDIIISNMDKYFPENTEFLTESLLNYDDDNALLTLYESVYDYAYSIFSENEESEKPKKNIKEFSKEKLNEMKKNKKEIKRKVAALLVIIEVSIVALYAIKSMKDKYERNTELKTRFYELRGQVKSDKRYTDNMSEEEVQNLIKRLNKVKKNLTNLSHKNLTDDGKKLLEKNLSKTKDDISFYKAEKYLMQVEKAIDTPIKRIISNVYLPNKYRNQIMLADKRLNNF